jgi:hypothetical protein
MLKVIYSEHPARIENNFPDKIGIDPLLKKYKCGGAGSFIAFVK